MTRIVLLAVLALAGCSHGRVITDMSGCNEVTGEKRVECNACLAQNKAGGWLGVYEYRPDADSGQRCTRTK